MTGKFALVIANTEYQDAGFAKLTAPGKDAEEFAQILRAPELAAFDDIQVLLNEGEGKTRRAIARFFADRKPNDLLLLYFSGHGVRNDQGHLFLAANDTEINILEATGIPAEFVTRAMNNSRSNKQLLILDCCNSGAFAHGSKAASGVGQSMGISTAFEGDGYGRVVLTATDATQFAWEGDKVIGNTQKSVFTHFLIEGLKGAADRDGDGRIKVDELYDYAYEQVVRRTPKQTPGKWTYKQQGDFVLRENIPPRDVPPAPLPPDLIELLSYRNISARKAGIQELIDLLDGKHKGLARAAEEKLREIATSDTSLDLRKMASDGLLALGLTLEALPLRKIPFEDDEQDDAKKNRGPISNPRLWGAIAGGLLLVSLCIWGSSKPLSNMLGVTPEPTRTLQLTATAEATTTFTPQPEQTNTPSPTRTLTFTPTSIALTRPPVIDIRGNVWNSSLSEQNKVDRQFVYSNNIVEDFSFEVDVTITDSSSELHGLMFRVDQENEVDSYRFSISQDGKFVLERWSERARYSLIGPRRSAFIRRGQGETNRLQVIARGQDFELYINGNRVGNARDTINDTGRIGLFSCTCGGSSSASATFSNLEVIIYP